MEPLWTVDSKCLFTVCYFELHKIIIIRHWDNSESHQYYSGFRQPFSAAAESQSVRLSPIVGSISSFQFVHKSNHSLHLTRIIFIQLKQFISQGWNILFWVFTSGGHEPWFRIRLTNQPEVLGMRSKMNMEPKMNTCLGLKTDLIRI